LCGREGGQGLADMADQRLAEERAGRDARHRGHKRAATGPTPVAAAPQQQLDWLAIPREVPNTDRAAAVPHQPGLNRPLAAATRASHWLARLSGMHYVAAGRGQ